MADVEVISSKNSPAELESGLYRCVEQTLELLKKPEELESIFLVVRKKGQSSAFTMAVSCLDHDEHGSFNEKTKDYALDRFFVDINALLTILMKGSKHHVVETEKIQLLLNYFKISSEQFDDFSSWLDMRKQIEASVLSQIGAEGGKAKSEAKKRSSAQNGKKGGRPRKNVI